MKSRLLALFWAGILAVSLPGCTGGEAARGEDPPALPVVLPQEEAPAQPPEEPPPAWEWPVGLPQDQGLNPAGLEAFHRALAEVDVRSALTVRNGLLIDEYYAEGYGREDLFPFASCTKSVTGALVGIAIDLRHLSGVDATLAEFLPEAAGTDKGEITVRDLLGHVSGIRWREWGVGTMFREFQSQDDWAGFILDQPMEADPGAFFNYTSGGSHLLSVILQRTTGQTAEEFALQHLFGPLGITEFSWRQSPQGESDGGSGLQLTARDAAKFGQLFLNGGAWEGEQIIPAWWVEASTAYQFPGSPGTGAYGYQWWLTSFGGHDLYYAMGHGGQYIFVVPGLDLVTVMTARTPSTYTPQHIFRDYLIPAFE